MSTIDPADPIVPNRARVRLAVERAWARAVASGALPVAPPDGVALPPVEIERPRCQVLDGRGERAA